MYRFLFTSLFLVAGFPGQSFNASADLTVASNFSQHAVATDENIELYLNRTLISPEQKIAVVIGNTDVTSLFKVTDQRLKYDATLWPLPEGESSVVVYVIGQDSEWRELNRFSLRVKKQNRQTDEEIEPRAQFLKAGFKLPFLSTENTPLFSDEAAVQDAGAPSEKPRNNHKYKFLPSLTLGLKSQPAQSTFPGSARPQRATFADLTLQASLRTEATYGLFNTQSSVDLAGSSFQQEALRFGTLGEEAPKVDLSSYLIQFQTGQVKYQVGHFSYGSERQLINSFSSRGVMITVPFLKRFDVSVAAMNGTQLVGYDNFFGLDKPRHQMLSSTLGFEFFPKRPGAFRLEVGLLNAYFQPISGVNRGVITDTQRSRGVAVRLIGNDRGGRFHFEGGFTRSLFISPNDETLSQGLTLVPIPRIARNAHFFEASYEVLKGFSLTETKKANLRVAFREENVAPLFRSLGASPQADKVSYEVDVDGSLDQISLQFGHNNFHDNLRNIPSILRSLNNTTRFSIATPFAALINKKQSSVGFRASVIASIVSTLLVQQFQ